MGRESASPARVTQASLPTPPFVTLLANESASRIGPVTGRAQGIAPTMRRLRKPVRAWWQRNVSFPSPGHSTLYVIRQQSLSKVGFFHKLGARNERPAHLVLPGTISKGLFNGFHSELDLDDVTHKETTGLQGQVPGQSEVVAVDRGPGIEGDNLPAHGILPTSGELGVQHDLACDAADGQIPDHLRMVAAQQLHAGALERDRGVTLDIQEIGGLQVIVAILYPRIQAWRIDLHFHRRAGWIGLVQDDGAAHALEVPLDRRKHHVLAGELDQRMRGVELPVTTGCNSRFTLRCHVIPSITKYRFRCCWQRELLTL